MEIKITKTLFGSNAITVANNGTGMNEIVDTLMAEMGITDYEPVDRFGTFVIRNGSYNGINFAGVWDAEFNFEENTLHIIPDLDMF